MKLGIMQPYFFPYLGYFDLIERTDRWVAFDVVKFTAKTWMTRNRVLHPTSGWQYINVPVGKMPSGTPIRDIRIRDKSAALTRILGQLEHYRRHAPYYTKVVDLVQTTFTATESDRLVDLNVQSQAQTCAYLGIPFDWSVCSEMDLCLNGIEHAGQWALRISQQLGAKEYINPPGGKEIFDPREWTDAGIELSFTTSPTFRYDCSPYEFCEHLSILDVLMWNESEAVLATLRGEAV
jgi:hypothetical protein